MPVQQISVTVDKEIYHQFEAHRLQAGQKRSAAVNQAIRMWVKLVDDALIAEGCKASREEDVAIAKASKTKALKALSRTL